MGLLMMLLGVLFLVLVVVGVVLLVRALVGRGGHPGGGSALETLEERYARGEIDRDEFEERRRLLGS